MHLFISDLHLCPSRLGTTALFHDFLAGPARTAASLTVLGDLFEYWAGDDDLAEPFNAEICAALRALADTGVPVAFMHGNRDFLAGAAFAAAAGLTLLADPHPANLFGQRFLLSHGDALCSDDAPYQRYRATVREPAWQAQFLARPLAERKQIIDNIRQVSATEKTRKTAAIMDVNPDAVAALLRAHDYPTLIHGHTHRPACHRRTLDGHECTRWVLHDWHEDCAGYLAIDAGGARAIDLP